MLSTRSGLSIVLLLILGLFVVGCGTTTPEADLQIPPPAFDSPLSTATPMPTLPSASTSTLVPTATALPSPTPSPFQLVVIHTNDNWGETEPCG